MLKLMSYAESATPAWLTEVLTREQKITEGQVASIKKKAVYKTPVTFITNLQITYSDDARGELPKTLIFKIKKRNQELQTGEKELLFYRHLSPMLHQTQKIRCYDAYMDVEKGISHLLLEDLSLTHSHPELPIHPPIKHCIEAVRILASFHAECWNRSELLQKVERMAGNRTQRLFLTKQYEQLEQQVHAFFAALGDRLLPERKAYLQEALSAGPYLFAPRWEKGPVTMVHGDAHFWNFLYPREEEEGIRPALIDWEYFDVGIGAMELAYTIGLWWFPTQRRYYEKSLLQVYHETLLEHGVNDYSFAQCEDDYRLGLTANLFMPAWHWSNGERAELWWHHLERCTAAYEDWNCREWLESEGIVSGT